MSDGDNAAAAAAYVRELQELRQRYRGEAVRELQELFKRRDRKPPEEFHGSSFLYLRSYDTDLGVRPFSNIVHWHSPDVTLSPLSGVGAYTTQLVAGETYLVRCLLRNRGDLAVPSAKVELFLTDPTLGFDTRFATNLTLGQVPSAWVPSVGSAAAELVWTVPPSEAGHKCLFARAFSFAPLELPVDDFALDPRIDRHVAQQNLNIVGQAQAYSFQWVHAPNARFRIALRALEPAELLRVRHPVLAEVKVAPEFPRRGWGRLAPIELREGGTPDVGLTEEPEGVGMQSKSRDGLTLDGQRELRTAVRAVVEAVHAGRTRMADHRKLLRRFRAMNAQAVRSRLSLQVPELGLHAGQAIGVELRAVDASGEPAEVAGGITLVVVGG